jgi:beta-phosphoglucomutase-like phosphatase (HAD superfamily)
MYIPSVLGLPDTVKACLFDLDGVRTFLASRGITLPEGTPDDLRAAESAGLRRAVVSASANARDVLRTTGSDRYIEYIVDGIVAREEAT